VPIVESWDLTEDPPETLIGSSHEAVGRAVARHLPQENDRRLTVLSADNPRGLRRSMSVIDELQRQGLNYVLMEAMPASATLQTRSATTGGR
jgi:LacI family gluconate utilization system Gnt-I transcriptional repressor